MTPTARTLKLLRDDGWLVEVVEQWNSYTRTRKDLFGFLDLLGISPAGMLGVQATSTSNVSARLTKIKTERAEQAKAWLTAGGKIEVIGWSKKKVKRGGRAVRWVPVRVPVTLADLQGEQHGTCVGNRVAGQPETEQADTLKTTPRDHQAD